MVLKNSSKQIHLMQSTSSILKAFKALLLLLFKVLIIIKIFYLFTCINFSIF
jgi:hypothetical protein